MQDKENYMLC